MLEKLKMPLRQLDTQLVFKYNNKLSQNLTKNKPREKLKCEVYEVPCKDFNQLY